MRLLIFMSQLRTCQVSCPHLQRLERYCANKISRTTFALLTRTHKHKHTLKTIAAFTIAACIGLGLTHFRRSQLHWLDVVDRVRFRVCVQVFRCLHKMAPEYLSKYYQPVSGISGRRHLRSADRGHLDFPRVKLASYGGRSFAYAGPSNWNPLSAYLETVVFLFHLLNATSKPFSFLLYINDLTDIFTDAVTVKLYADDVKIYSSIIVIIWWRKSSNMTVGQCSLIYLAHHCYDWHPGSRCG